MKLHYPYGQPPEGVDVLWRCEAKRYASFDEDGDVTYISDPKLEVRWYKVNRRTPKGAWINGHWAGEIWSKGQLVTLSHNKAFARNTVDEAVKDFIARRKRQIAILQGQLQRAERELNLTLVDPRNPHLGFSSCSSSSPLSP